MIGVNLRSEEGCPWEAGHNVIEGKNLEGIGGTYNVPSLSWTYAMM